MSNPQRGSKKQQEEANTSSSSSRESGGGAQIPILDPEASTSSGSSSPSSGEKTIRGRGGFKAVELRTIPSNITEVKSKNPGGQPCDILANFIKVKPMPERHVYQYRVDFEPQIDSVPLRRRLLNHATERVFSKKVIFDGMSDARSGHKTESKVNKFTIEHPNQPGTNVQVTVKLVGTVSGSFEMIRVYNMHMKTFLRALGFFPISSTGAYVHEDLKTPIGSGGTLVANRGYRTSANVHENNQILMNLESVHKIMQTSTVLDVMKGLRNSPNFKEAIRAQLTGKLVVTDYVKVTYRIEDVDFDKNPKSTFPNSRTGGQTSYFDYFRERYNCIIRDTAQPLLLVVQNSKRRDASDGKEKECYIVPELCKIAGLTDQQRNDNRLKIDLVRSSQIPPADRVAHLNTFLKKLHECKQVKEVLETWGYEYEKEPLKIKARILPLEVIGMGRAASGPTDRWTKVDNMASFDGPIQRECLAVAPVVDKLSIVISATNSRDEGNILGKLRKGFERVGLAPKNVNVIRMKEGDGAHHYVNYLKRLEQDSQAALVILPQQNKERYDAVKKIASVERGLITQCVTGRLMMDDRKAGGASIKIAIQMAAKLGGEPWYINLPLTTAMVCGYDTYHDTTNRGRSFGAFVASMNNRFSRWFSKADSHDRLDELSTHMAENLGLALNKYKEIHDRYPDRVFIYRDGVGDGQLDHVFNTELKTIKRTVQDADSKIRLTMIIVNKRVGARFYMRGGNSFINCPPGTVIDDIVTRKERYDFYLVSQSTRNGTVAPTYYNILHDESGLDPAKHQAMAYKMCLIYYNWSGTVRVPAPCQYAHKLALLCGEHLHAVPNAGLDDRLHFL